MNSLTALCTIMQKHGSDKGGINQHHNYTLFYHALFQNYKDFKLRVFELGIGTNNVTLPSNMGKDGVPGASLRGWAEYFNNSDVFGADIDRDILFQDTRIKTYYCDQLDSQSIIELWANPDLEEEFDIIIEDGLHRFDANVCFFENSISKLKPGGVYIIEDIVCKDIHLYENIILDKWASVYKNVSFRLVNIPHANTYDNCLLIAVKNKEL